ncbi:CHAT domain-containing protein, partial [Crocosphaera watsonii]
LKEAIAINPGVGVNPKIDKAIALRHLGTSFLEMGRLKEAEKNLYQSIKINESLRQGISEDRLKISFYDQQYSAYILLQQALTLQNKTTEALEISERGRSRAFVELLSSQVWKNSNQKALSTPPKISELKQIASQQKATLVEYSVINNQLIYVWVIPPSGEITFKQINLTSLDTPIAELVKITRDSIGVRGRGETDNNTETKGCKNNQKCLQQLHSILIEPIASSLPKDPNEKVIFIPHEQLFLVPFAALQDQEGNYLIEKHTIVTAPSIQVLDLTQKIRQQQQPPSDMLIVGIDKISYSNPPAVPRLDNAEKEALTIAKLYNTQAIIGEKATETLIKEKMSDAGVIHLATHGLLEELKPLQNLTPEELKRFDLLEYKIPGAIALTPSESDNGLLTANEILKLKLKAQLVVLSACNTGKGDITGDGVVGLSRSLMEAGVPSVLVSLWYVPDAPTSDLMIEFHRQWKQGKNKAQALREAMLETMKNHPDPKNWAAFTLIGESE